MRAGGSTAVQTATVTIGPDHFLAGWRPDAGSLFVPALSEAQLGDEVAVRVGLIDSPYRATLFGTVGVVRRVGRPSLPPGVELQLDAESRRAAGWLADAARGVEPPFRLRPPRFLAARQLLVLRDRVTWPVTTLNVSANGGALQWSGELPEPGEPLMLRLGDGLLAAAPEAVVAWIERSASGTGGRVGIRIVSEGRAGRVWARMADDLARTGAARL
jgi:hypothetical protein